MITVKAQRMTTSESGGGGATVAAVARTVVLVVEDDPTLQLELSKALASSTTGHEVLLASSKTAAMLILDERHVDAIVLDSSLPDADPVHTLAELHLRPSPPPVVVLSDTISERAIVDAMKHGAADYVRKGADLAITLGVVVDRAIESAGLRERLRTQERQYQDLIEASNDAIYILVGQRFRYVNQRFAELFGYSVDDLTDPDLDYQSLIAPESRPLVAERGRRMRANEPLPSRYEFEAVRRDGTHFDVEVSVSYIHYDGAPAVLGILTDITARKAYEKTLLRKNHELSVLNAISEATTRARDLAQILEDVVERIIELLEVDAAGIAILEPDRRQFSSMHYRGASETFVREMKVRGTEAPLLRLVLETQRMQILPDLLAEPRFATIPAAREGFRSALGLPLVSHGRCSGVITVFTRKPRAFSDDEIHLFIALSRQITVAIENARLYKKAQEGIARLQALSEIARAIGSTLEVEGVFRILGDRLQTIVPYRRISLNIIRRDGQGFSVRTIDRPDPGQAAVVRLHEPLNVGIASTYIRALEKGTTLLVTPSELPSTGVEPAKGRAISERAHPALPDQTSLSAIVPIIADNTPLGVIVVSTDEATGFRERDLDLLRDLAAHMAISLKNARVFHDLERAYRELRDTKDRLVRSEKLQGLGEMAAGVAHDFNNVLSAILGRAQMLKVMLHDEQMLKSVRVIEKAALDGAGTVRRIQEFAKERSEGEFVQVRINPLVRDAVDMTTTRVNDLGIDIDMQVELGEAGWVLGNPTELREVLTNLIHNAIDAMPHGGRLSIRTGTLPLGDREPAEVTGSLCDQVWFEVEDTGIGMDEETQRKIFDPFFTTKGTRGTGLGLSVSYGIVQRHKGEFSLRSKRGAGTTIRVLFPAGETLEDDFSPREISNLTPLPQQILVTAPRPEVARILVIDDDSAVRDVLADILRTAAHHVVAAASGAEGLELFRAEPFDLVFTDLGMPGMNGWEVAQGIKALSPKTPVGLITGWGSSLDDAKIKDRGVDLIVSKPFRYNQVLELVTEAMALRGRIG
ncbi:response regulator [Myxococcota bacterium]|nr:response regulator [Myxococcota bacterium]